MKLTLYYASGSCSLAAHWCLAEAAADYDLAMVDLASHGQTSPAFLAINPLGQVPALAVDDQIVTELAAILVFVSRRYPDAQLMPFHDPLKLAETFEWLSWLSTTGHRAIAQVFRPERFSRDSAAFAGIGDAGRATLRDLFGLIDASLEGRTYALGDAFSAVDPFLFVFHNWSLRLGYEYDHWPNFFGHALRMIERPAAAITFERENWTPPLMSVPKIPVGAGCSARLAS